MIVRVVDYTGNEGGGVRFTVELLAALARRHPEARFELVSHGAALRSYRALLGTEGPVARYLDLPPLNQDRRELPRWLRVPLGGTLARLLGRRMEWTVEVPPAAVEGCDVAWFPWVHNHRIPPAVAARAVGSFHDALWFTVMRPHQPADNLRDETATVRSWLDGPARMVVSARATAADVAREFGVPAERFPVVPVSGEHTFLSGAPRPLPAEWTWAEGEFLLCPANTSPHKNHEVLLRGVGAWGGRRPLVLTGGGTDLPEAQGFWWRRALQRAGVLAPARGRVLRRVAAEQGLRMGDSLVGLGYVSDPVYHALLHRAWALVMPTLGEGGGSFPVFEAMLAGVPVVCSDIAPLREQMERTGGEVLWFDPRDPAQLAARLAELEADYPALRDRARAQAATLRPRSWDHVADEYWTLFQAQAALR
jgi:glycosyltransferase involved in cell wall biosynthesis